MNRLFFVAVFFLISACQHVPGSGPRSLTIQVAADRKLSLDPCGCSLGPLGGLAREWAYGQSDREPKLYVSTGVSFGETRDISRARLFVTILGELGVDAIGISSLDLGLGVDRLRELQGATSAAFVSTNIVGPKGEPLFAESSVKKEILLLSVTRASKALPSGVRIEKPEVSIARVLRHPSSEGKLVVVLADLPRDEIRALALRDLGAHVWLAVSEGDEGAIEQVGARQLILAAPGLGRALGRLRLTWGAGGSEWGAVASFYNELYSASADASRARLAREGRGDELARLRGIPTIPTPLGVTYEWRMDSLDARYDRPDEPVSARIKALKPLK